MDFTYFVAAFVAFIVGIFASLMFVLASGGSKVRLIGGTIAASIAINGLALVNWSRIGDFRPSLLLADFAFIAAYSVIGCLVGILPALGLRSIWRWLSKRTQ